MASDARGHKWRFFRAGGFDQVRLETAADLLALDQLDLADLQAIDPRIGEGALAALTLDSSVAARTSAGGTAPDRVREAVRAARAQRSKP